MIISSDITINAVIFVSSAGNLQKMLNALNKTGKEYDLKINVKKTKWKVL